MNRVALVLSSTRSYSPYVEQYTALLDEIGVPYDLVEWDRIGDGCGGDFVYSDGRVGIRRGAFSYVGYLSFVRKKLAYDYACVVVFGIQLHIALASVLLREIPK